MQIRGRVTRLEERTKNNNTWYVVSVENDEGAVTGVIWTKPLIKEGEEVLAEYHMEGQYTRWDNFTIPKKTSSPSAATSGSGYRESEEDYRRRQEILTRQGVLNAAMEVFKAIDAGDMKRDLALFDMIYYHILALVKAEDKETEDDDSPPF